MFELDFVFPTSASTKSLNNHGPPGAADFLLRMDGAGGGDELAAVAFLKGCPMSAVKMPENARKGNSRHFQAST